jgi:ribosomal protein S18 acetylase RimI-like enzyme
MRLVAWTGADMSRRLNDVIEVYGQAMGYSTAMLESRRGYIATHVQRPGFRAVATLDEAGQLIGFGYGYTSASGQWWHDQVRSGLTKDARNYWLKDCFEIVELHVRPSAQGYGIGAGQLTALLHMAPGSRVLLSTPEADEQQSRAWRLYRRFGFVDLLRHFYFPGDARPFAILGRTLHAAGDPVDAPPVGQDSWRSPSG